MTYEVGAHLLVDYLNSTQMKTITRNVLAVALDLVGYTPTRSIATASTFLLLVFICVEFN